MRLCDSLETLCNLGGLCGERCATLHHRDTENAEVTQRGLGRNQIMIDSAIAVDTESVPPRGNGFRQDSLPTHIPRLCPHSDYRQFLVRVISCDFVDRLLRSEKTDPLNHTK